ncbi:myb-like protein H [Hordeum vulgare subsp. vulgare]|uniref:myb-like protein H n=1 Tax=Hordeum vulgare subsp. vulgare TaxID=112509 RepID=UPI000295ADCB|nr:myb-like protein H [Hordeum vulgare subsp. vulgare]
MDPFVNQGWTSSEEEEARSLIAEHNSHGIMNDENNNRHNNIVDAIHELFPSKTRQQVTNLYINLEVESYMMNSREESYVGGNTQSVCPNNLVNNNFGMSGEGSGTSNICGINTMGDHVIGGYGVREEEAATIDRDGLIFGRSLEDARIAQTNESMLIMDKNKMQVLENNVPSDQTVVPPRQRRFWTIDEHKMFLRGLRVYGRGDWKNISKHFVTTKTHIQVSSHAQKYFKRINKRASFGTQRYSINDVGLDDDDLWAVNNSSSPSQMMGFNGLNNETSFGMHDPTSSSIVMNNQPHLWPPVTYSQQENQQPMWSEHQMLGSTTVVMGDMRNSAPPSQ